MANKLNDNTVFLVDGSGYIFRAFFAIRSLHSKKGVPTNAVFGFTNMLIKLIKEHQPKYLAIAFDRKEPTFRHKIYDGYKANRPSPPEDLIPQFALIHRMVEAFNIKLLSIAGYEADDLLATMKQKAIKEGHNVVIVTGDKDLMQLVDDQTLLLDELRASRSGLEEFIGKDEVKLELGVPPEHVVDLLALAGDASDNVPGVSGIGKKTAAELINEFGSVEKILQMIPLIKQKARKDRLMEGHHLALLSKKLVMLDTDAPVECAIDEIQYNGPDEEKLKELFLELDFTRQLQDRALFKAPVTASQKEGALDASKYQFIRSDFELHTFLKNISSQKIGIYLAPDFSGLAISNGENQAGYIPESEQISKQKLKEVFSKLLTSGKKIVVEDGKKAQKLLMSQGFADCEIAGDPMLQSYLLDQQGKHSLADLARKYLNIEPLDKNLESFPAMQADLALRLESLLNKEIESSNLLSLYHELELPLEKVLARMELFGVKIDTKALLDVAKDLKERLLSLEEKAYELAEEKFNLASPKQVAELLFEKLKLKAIKKNKTGFSTDSSVLEKLVDEHPIIDILLKHRIYAKLLNTYVDSLPSLVGNDGRLHTSYNQFVTATGRLSSSDPNLQNIPARTKEGRKIRKAFVAEDGFKLISLDYSQVELRLLALVSQDPVLLDSFAKDQDVHKRTASEIFEVATENVTKEQRDAAKTINFGLLYGMGVHKLSQTLTIPRKSAQSYLEKYYAKYAGVFRWKTEILLSAKKDLAVRTLFGRMRSLPELSSKNGMEQAKGERIAINTPIQGTAADIIKKAMIDTDKFLTNNFPKAKLIMQVHDELVIEALESEAQEIAQKVALIMSQGHGLDLDLKVDYKIADNWDDAH